MYRPERENKDDNKEGKWIDLNRMKNRDGEWKKREHGRERKTEDLQSIVREWGREAI